MGMRWRVRHSVEMLRHRLENGAPVPLDDRSAKASDDFRRNIAESVPDALVHGFGDERVVQSVLVVVFEHAGSKTLDLLAVERTREDHLHPSGVVQFSFEGNAETFHAREEKVQDTAVFFQERVL